MEALLIAIVNTLLNVVCFLIGAKVGQKVSKGEAIELPNPNPIEAIRKHQNKREADRKLNRLETIMNNIETYDGSSIGQREVPRGE